MKIVNVGRASSNDVVVNSPVVSSLHAVLYVHTDGTVDIKDCQSSNGTFVNDKRATGTVTLKPGDRVKLGNVDFDWQRAAGQGGLGGNSGGGCVFPPDVVDRRSIGRGVDVQIRLNYDDVSSKHAYLCRRSNGEVVLVDNNSTNGTYVNGTRISTQTLHKGDTVLIARKYPLQWEQVFPSKDNTGGGGNGGGGNSSLKWVLVAAAVVLVAGVGLWWLLGGRSWSPEKVYATYRKSVVMIYQKSAYVPTVNGKTLGEYLGVDKLNYLNVDGEGDIAYGVGVSSGTGFFFSKDGKIMTNRHVVGAEQEERENEKKIKSALQNMLLSEFGNSKEARWLAANLEVNYQVLYTGIALNDTHVSSESDLIACTIYKVSTDEKIDIAIIQTNNKVTPPEVDRLVDLNDIATMDELKPGKRIYTIGFPQAFLLGGTEVGLEANNQSGEVTQERGEYQYGHNITIHQGASGSPVFDDRGRFAGVIVSGYLGLSQGYNQAVQPQKAVSLLK
jgi:pSer/pThr/pTyr-binding forkhead associated (FHA) protein/S1-C subfamily serine protease